MANWRTEFQTWGEFLAYCQDGPTRRGNSSHDTSYGEEWSGTGTWDEAMTLARDGWPEGTRKVATLADRLTNQVMAKLPITVWRYDTEGANFDMGRVLEGVPECWSVPEEKTIEGTRYFRVVLNLAASGGVDSSILMARGALACALTLALEQLGHRVEVVCGMSVNDRFGPRAGSTIDTMVTVKPFDAPVDLDRLAYAMVNPSIFRRLMFSIIERRPDDGQFEGVFAWGYGYPCDMFEGDRGDVYLGPAQLGDRAWANVNAAEKWVLDKLRELGVLAPSDPGAEPIPEPVPIPAPYVPYHPKRRRRRY